MRSAIWRREHTSARCASACRNHARHTGIWWGQGRWKPEAVLQARHEGNPAGVWIGDVLPDPESMQKIATEVGFSETAFVAPAFGPRRAVRYYSPETEVSFCGHATIAAGVMLGEAGGDGTYRLATAVGEVPVTVRTRAGYREASLTSIEPTHTPAPDALVTEALAALRWSRDDLSEAIPPARAYAGAWHLVLVVADAERLAQLDYDFEALKKLMLRDDLTTLQLVWREGDRVFHSRNPFPVGGAVEDPVTGGIVVTGAAVPISRDA